MDKKRLIRSVGYVLISLILAIIAGTILMVLVYLLPVSKIKDNIYESRLIYQREGDYYNWAPWRDGSRLDNFTDSLMLNIAIFPGTGSVIVDAMKNYWLYYPELEAQGSGRTLHLFQAMEEESSDKEHWEEYSYYWHGYLVWLKPLLCITELANIRILNMYLQLALLILVIIELYKISGYKIAIPFFMSMLIINPVSTILCMQYACMYYIALISVLILLKRRIYESPDQWKLFLWIGISTAFFDFLTYPLVGLCTGLLIITVLDQSPFFVQLKKIILNSFAWLIGYAGMWVGKWVMCYATTNETTGGFEQVIYRMIGDTGQEAPGLEINLIYIMKQTFKQVWRAPMPWIYELCMLLPILLLLTRKCKLTLFRSMIPVWIIGGYPFIWFLLVKNHSVIHIFLSHKNWAVTFFAMGLSITYSLAANNSTKEKRGK